MLDLVKDEKRIALFKKIQRLSMSVQRLGAIVQNPTPAVPQYIVDEWKLQYETAVKELEEVKVEIEDFIKNDLGIAPDDNV